MRTLLALLILVVVGLIAVVASGVVDIHQTRPAELPEVSVTDKGVSAKGGRQPTFDVETGSVAVGTETRAVTVPTLEVESAPEPTTDSPTASPTAPAGS